MRAIFDTSVLHDDLPMSGLRSRVLLDQARRQRFELVVPEVVVLEISNKARERIEQATNKLAAASASLAKLEVPPGLPIVNPQALTILFVRQLRDRITNASGRIPEIPNPEHASLVERSIRGTKPFRTSGVGYRDALIWLTVVNEADGDTVAFVSANTSDFANEDELHPDLEAELTRVGRSGAVTLYTDLDAFIAACVPVDEQALSQAQHLLSAESTFADGLRASVGELLGSHAAWPYHTDIDFVHAQGESRRGEDSPDEVYVETYDLLELAITNAYEVEEDGTGVIDLEAKVELTVDLLFDKAAAEWLVERRSEVSFHDWDYNETYAAGDTTIYVVGRLTGLFDPAVPEVRDLELMTVNDLPENDPAHPASGNADG
jgi:predicted nucleic acid-binding protein